MLRISICFLRSINKHYTKPQKRQQHACVCVCVCVDGETNGKPTRKLHLSPSVLFVVSRNERYPEYPTNLTSISLTLYVCGRACAFVDIPKCFRLITPRRQLVLCFVTHF